MKDYSFIQKHKDGKFYYNKNDRLHKLTSAASSWYDGDKFYYINGIRYMEFFKNDNVLVINTEILKLTSKYEKYIKQNIKDLIIEYNPEIILNDDFYTQKGKLKKIYLNKLPDWLKDFIIL